MKIKATDSSGNSSEHTVNVNVIDLYENNVIYSSNISPPGKIINGSNTTITDDIVVTNNFKKLKKLEVILNNITHTWVGDLKITLTNVNTGTSLILMNLAGSGQWGSSGDNFLNTTLSDSATKSINSITPSENPYSGKYYPHDDTIRTYLSSFNGENINSTWRLTINDTYPSHDHGYLKKWSLKFEQDDTSPVITGPTNKSINENTKNVHTFTANESVSWSLSGGTDQSKFQINTDGLLSFIIAPDYENPLDTDSNNIYNVKIRATDSSDNSSEHTINVSVINVDDTSPIITGPSGKSINENTTIVHTFTANEDVTWEISGGADQSMFQINKVNSNGVLSFITAPDYENPSDADSNNIYNVKIKATDSSNNSNEHTINVSVINVDDTSPIITGPSSKSINENTTVVHTFTANEDVTWEISGGTDQSMFQINKVNSNGVLSFITAPDYENPSDADSNNIYNVKIKATDSSNNSNEHTINVSVINVDETSPIITGPTSKSINENTTNVHTFTANEDVTWEISGGADQSMFQINTNGLLSFITAPDYENPTDSDSNNIYNVKVKATDSSNNSNEHTINVSIINVDETSPIITGPTSKSITENTTNVHTFTANEDVTWEISGGADQSMFQINKVNSNGVLSFITAPDYENPSDADSNNIYNVKIKATDSSNNSNEHTINVSVINVDDTGPIITGPTSKSINENTTFVHTFTANEAVIWEVSGGADQTMFQINKVNSNGVLSFKILPNYENPSDADGNNIYNVKIKATDSSGNSSEHTINVSVVNVNDTDLPFEFGQISLNHKWKTVNISKTFVNPVVILSDPTFYGSDPVSSRIRNVTSNSFEVKLQEPNYRDEFHVFETINYIVGENGYHTLNTSNGKLNIEFGKLNTNKLSSEGFDNVDMIGFQDVPVVMSQIQTYNGPDWVLTRTKEITNNNFKICMQEEEILNNGFHLSEEIGWMAVSKGSFNLDNMIFESKNISLINHNFKSINFESNFSTVPLLFTKLSSFNGPDTANTRIRNVTNKKFDIMVYEEQSLDNEIFHLYENVSYFCIFNN